MAIASNSSVSDLIRDYVRKTYVVAAIRNGEDTFKVNIGVVHKALRLTNRVPQVCAALESRKFLDENRLRIVSRSGPPSGRSTTVTLTYEMVLHDGNREPLANPLLKLRGLAKDVFARLGGAESFIRSERASFVGSTKK